MKARKLNAAADSVLVELERLAIQATVMHKQAERCAGNWRSDHATRIVQEITKARRALLAAEQEEPALHVDHRRLYPTDVPIVLKDGTPAWRSSCGAPYGRPPF